MARIAVIGAGMAALAAAARLAAAGHRVVVFERGGTYGGSVGRLARDGFAFDTGPGLLTLPAVYRDLFVKTGRASLEDRVKLVQVDPASRHVFADGTEVALPNASRSGAIAALDAALGPGSGERWTDVMVRARQTWEAIRRPMLEEALPADTGAFGRDPYPAVRRGFAGLGTGRRRGAPSLARTAAAELREPRLVALLESYAVAYGVDPRVGPASAAVLPYLEATFGVWYPRGGVRALADAAYARCRERGVEFRFGSEVTGLLVRDGRAAGVRLADGTREEAAIVVAGAPGPGAGWDAAGPAPDAEPAGAEPADGEPAGAGAATGAGPGSRSGAGTGSAAGTGTGTGAGTGWGSGSGAGSGSSAWGGEAWPGSGARGGPGRCTVFVALRGSRPAGAAHRTVVHAADRDAALDWAFGKRPASRPAPGALTVTVLRPDDPASRPDDGHEAVTLAATVPAHAAPGGSGGGGGGGGGGGPHTVDWDAAGAADAVAERMAEAAEAAVPGLRERELWREVRTPADVERELAVPGGSVPPPSLAGAGGLLLRPPNRAPLPGLYLVGGWSHPGGGLPHAGMSAAIAADLIAGGPGASR